MSGALARHASSSSAEEHRGQVKTPPPARAIRATLTTGDDVHTWVGVSGDLAWIYDVDVLRVWSLADPELTSRDIELPFQAR